MHPQRFCRLAAMALLTAGWAASAVEWVTESERALPVAAVADVVIVGGSTGAVAAAVAAARSGASVYLLSPRPYLGEDMAATLRLWLEPGEEPRSELARAIFSPAAHRDHLPGPAVLPFAYTTSLPSAARHADSVPPARLRDGRCHSAAAESVQYDGDVAVIADLGKETDVATVTAMVYHRADYCLARLSLSSSPDGEAWRPLAESRCELPEQAGPESAAEPVRLVLPAPLRTRYLRLAFTRAPGATRVLLGEIELQPPGATDAASTAAAQAAIRPLHLKQVLDDALLAAKVPFLYSSLPTEVLRDRAGRLCGVAVANRAGRQVVVAKAIVDATERATVAMLAGASFRPSAPGTREFRRTVIGGEPRPFPGGRVRAIEPALFWQAQAYPVYEYLLPLALAADDWRSRMAAENQARTLTYDPRQQFASEVLFHVPAEPVIGEATATGPWPGSGEALPLGVFQPRGCPGLWLLGGRADVSREAAAALLRPLALMDLGDRIGRAAADLAKALPAPPEPRLEATAAGPLGGMDTREVLDGPRPFLAWERLPAGARQLPVLGRWDVVVVGGGVSGAPAAIGAARQGVSTLLIEVHYALGGVGTLGAISSYCHGYRAGFTAEVPGTSNWPIEERAEWWRKTALAAGAEIWFGTLGCGALVEEGRVSGVVVATPYGRGAILAGTVIDATGNADIAAAAGAACVTTDGSGLAVQGTGLPPRNLGASYTNTDFTLCDETDMVDVTSLLVYSKRKYRPGTFDQGVLVDTRERRRIVGEATLTLLDALVQRTYPDTVLLARTNYDTHGYTVDPFFLLGELPASRRIDCFLPYRCLIPRGLEGLLVTGLGLSAHRDAQPLVRMQPDLQNLGYACGVAAAMAQAQGGALRRVDVRQLQRHLVGKGCLPAAVLEQGEMPSLPAQELATAVAAVPEDGDLALVLAHAAQARPGLQAAYAQARTPATRLRYALVLAVLGDGVGAPELAATVAAQADWDTGWNYKAMGQFGRDLSPLDCTVVALGRTRHPAALEPILRLAQKLDAGKDFSHHRAVALALEALGDPRAAPVLAVVLGKPGMSGHALASPADAAVAHTQTDPSLNALVPRRNSLREICLARALYRCGDHDGLGERLLRAYVQDIRGHFARHAKAVLDAGPGPGR